jgi:hypothetical protein
MRRVVETTFVTLAACALAACGATPTDVPDASRTDAPAPPDAGVDAPPAACNEIRSPEVTITALPAHAAGNIDTCGADLLAPASCAVTDAPYGVQSAGDDEVIALTELTPGTDYVARLVAAADLSFYVVTGCSGTTGPSAQQCLLYEDATTTGPEVGHFVAPQSEVWIVIDYYASTPPSDGSWSMDVYPSQCNSDAQCGGTTPACLDGRCVGCSSSFDCPTAAKPVCNGQTHACVAGSGGCTGDDPPPIENGDDGPAGARPLVPDATGHTQTVGHVCNTPSTELDFFSFDVTQPGEDWEATLYWSTSADLQMSIYDATGRLMGLSYWEEPEDIVLTYLPVGTYYVAIAQNAQQSVTQATPYTLRTTRVTDACLSASDCAIEYRNQIYRGDCNGGACIPLQGSGALPLGAACDSVSDCRAGSSCASFYFTANADVRDVCGAYCNRDSDCATAMGPGFVCTTYLPQNFCVEACTTDAQCPVSTTTVPTAGPWARLRCDRASGGHCE